jgi:hypothetical protein
MSMGNWWKDFLDGLFDFFERLGSERTRNSLEGILKLILIGCRIAEKFNTPLTGEEKAKFVRLLVRMVKYGSREEIEALAAGIVDLKNSGEIEGLKSWELDKTLGDGIALFMAGQEIHEPSDGMDIRDQY